MTDQPAAAQRTDLEALLNAQRIDVVAFVDADGVPFVEEHPCDGQGDYVRWADLDAALASSQPPVAAQRNCPDFPDSSPPPLTDLRAKITRCLELHADAVMVECGRCKGRGYHHGFGEHGHDPDWCEICGGPGEVAHPDYANHEPLELLAAALAALEASQPERDWQVCSVDAKNGEGCGFEWRGPYTDCPSCTLQAAAHAIASSQPERAPLPGPEPKKVSLDFLRGVASSTTSYSEGWRELAARTLWLEASLIDRDERIAVLITRAREAEALAASAPPARATGDEKG